MMMVAALLTAPDGSGHKIVGLAAGHFGEPADAEAAVKPIKSFGPPVMDMLGPIPFSALNGMLDASYPAGAKNYWRTHFLLTMPDAAIDVLLAQAAKAPTAMCQIVIEHFHGAATRVPVDATAFALRDAGYNTLILGQWMDAGDGDTVLAWVRETSAAIQPFVGPVRYMNYLNHDESGDPAAAAYGPNLARLKQLKKKYDPDNVFRLNVNIKP